jgi:hypothetical protein
MQDPEEPTDPELEKAIENTQRETVSAPPPEAGPLPCRAHGAKFARVLMKLDGSNSRVFEDGCEEPL